MVFPQPHHGPPPACSGRRRGYLSQHGAGKGGPGDRPANKPGGNHAGRDESMLTVVRDIPELCPDCVEKRTDCINRSTFACKSRPSTTAISECSTPTPFMAVGASIVRDDDANMVRGAWRRHPPRRLAPTPSAARGADTLRGAWRQHPPWRLAPTPVEPKPLPGIFAHPVFDDSVDHLRRGRHIDPP
jgi:hypothetical protein